MKYDTNHRIIQEPSFLMKIVNLFRDKCEKCDRYCSYVARFIPKCSGCWNASLMEYAEEERKKNERETRRKAGILAEEINRC